MTKPRLVLAVWLLLLALGGWMATRTPVVTDLSLFIPASDDAAQLLTELREGPAGRLILVGLTGADETALAHASVQLADRLQASTLFVRVVNGAGGLDEEERRQLFAYRYLLSPAVTAERFSAPGLRSALETRLSELTSTLSPLVKRLLPADPTGELLTLLDTWEQTQGPARRQGVWFDAAGERALLLLETRAPGFDLDAQDRVLATLQTAFAEIKQGDMRLLSTGTPVFATQSRDTIRSETQRLSLTASVLVVLFLALAYRHWRPLLLGLVPLLSAFVGALAVTGAAYGQVYGITLAFGTTLLGVAIDYPLHLFSHLDRGSTVADSLRRIWPTLRLGVLTTTLGYLAMIATAIPGLAQLGVFTVTGLLAAAAATRWVLPALLPDGWEPRRAGAEWLARWLRPSRWATVVFCTLGGSLLVVLIVLDPPLWEDDLAALSPVPRAALVLDRELRSALGAPEAGQMIVIKADSPEAALQTGEQLLPWLAAQQTAGAITGYDLAARYLPSVQTQQARQQALPERAQLAASLAEAQQGLPFRPGLFTPFLDAVSQAKQSKPLTLDDIQNTALALRVGSLLFVTERGWTALIPLAGVRDVAQLAGDLTLQGLPAVYLNLKAETDLLVLGFREAALERFGWGALLIVLALVIGLRRFGPVLRVLGPVTLALLLTVTLLLVIGERLSLFHLIALLLVLGLGLDYSLFFSRRTPDPEERPRTLHAVGVCALSTLAVFGMLALSELPVLRAVGLTVASGVALSFVAGLLLAGGRD